MRTRFPFLVVLVALIVTALPQGARAEWQTADCPAGQFLIGLQARSGVWVDRLGPICGHWNAATGQIDTTFTGPLLATSTGGSPKPPAQCPQGTAISTLAYNLPSINGQFVAENIYLTCRALNPPHNESPDHPLIPSEGTGRSDNEAAACFLGKWPCYKNFGPGAPDQITSCDANSIGSGFIANVAQFVGKIGIRCSPWPAAAPPQAASAPPAAPRPVISHLGHVRPPSAAPIEGSWYLSCTKASLYQNVLSASCKTTTGLEVSTSLDVTTCNQPPTAANINGKLVCENGVASASASPSPPPAPSPGTAAGVPPSDVVEGDWKSSEGAMTFTQNGKRHLEATYAQDSGRIRAEREGGHWVGFWSEAKSNHKCNHPRMGSDYWGQMDFVFTDENRHFEGMWSYCDALPASGSKWSGDRVK